MVLYYMVVAYAFSNKPRAMAALLALVAAMALPQRALCGEYVSISGNGVVVEFEAPVREAALAVLEAYPRVRADLEDALGMEPGFQPRVVIIKDRREFERLAGGGLIAAFALPGEGTAVLDFFYLNKKPFTLDATLRHEVCHLLLAEGARGVRIPKCFEEGVCQWAGGGPSEVLALGGETQLTRATLLGALIPLGELDDSFPSGERRFVLAYEEGRSVVEYIAGRHGRAAVVGLLNRLRAGEGMDEALRGTVGTGLEGLEAAWRADLIRGHTWIRLLGENIYELLFVLAALVTVIGFIRVMARIRGYRDEDGDEDDIGGGDGGRGT